ncbi:YhgE/Pip family protein [Cryobacterium melibiosiphilum]|nr:YhgE/Pip family protein [Cryobacterium melibiosiphilum]
MSNAAMSNAVDNLFRRTSGQRRRGLYGLVAGLIVVPLFVAGLFTAALSAADERIDTIPAIVVNNDEFVTTTLPDGTEQQVLAGRQLVTELTASAADGGSAAGFDWTISNSADAAAALERGDAYAVLTIPADFSASVTSLGGASPTQADLDIRTDDAHSYLAGSAAQSVGTAMTSAFGQAITAQYLTALYTNLAELGGSLIDAADGAAQVSTGVTSVATGLDSLAAGTSEAATGATAAATGAASFVTGVSGYTTGVDSLSTGLGTLSTGAAGLTPLAEGWGSYTGGVTSAATGFDGLSAALLQNPTNAGFAQALAEFDAGLDTLAAQGAGLSQQTTSAVAGVQGGIAASASGAARLSAGSAELRLGASGVATGVGSLSSGVAELATGASAAADGAHELETGASALATGLAEGAESASVLTETDAEATAAVVSAPVGVTTERNNAIDSIGPIIGMLFVPVGLWIGALAIFLVFRPLTAVALASTASTGRLLFRGLGRAFGLAAAQAVLVTLLLHGPLGVSWTLLPATLGFAVLLAAVFVAVHHLLTVAFGRVGIVVSLVLLALQLVATGGLYPLQIVAGPFQSVSPLLPLTWAVQGMQAIVSGGSNAAVDAGAAAAVLTLFLVGAVLLSWFTIARKRGARSFALAPVRA